MTTAFAALLTAVGGLLIALWQVGLLPGSGDDDAHPADGEPELHADTGSEGEIEGEGTATAPATGAGVPDLPRREPLDIPAPMLSFQRAEVENLHGVELTRYWLAIRNFSHFPKALFQAAPHLPPCGSNTQAARTWVDIVAADTGSRLYGFCGLDSPEALQRLWFAVRRGETTPARVYVVLHDREANRRYQSNAVRIP